MSNFHKDGFWLGLKFIPIAICGASIQALDEIGKGIAWQLPFMIILTTFSYSVLMQVHKSFKK